MMLKNKTAIITGGGRGIGKAAVIALAKEGCRVFAVSRSLSELQKLQKELLKDGIKIWVKKVDVSNYTQVQKLINVAVKQFKTIDILVNAAGIYGPIGLLVDDNLKDWAKTIQVNLLGTVNCVHAVLPVMIKKRSGKIINFSGGGVGVKNFPHFSSYAASKAAVVSFTETVAEECRSKNIQINAITPGAVNTKMLDQVLRAGVKAVGKEFYEKNVKQKKDGGDSPEIAANLVLFLASSRSGNLSGKLISAKWDNWQEWDEAKIKYLNSSADYTIRRIDNKFYQIKK